MYDISSNITDVVISLSSFSGDSIQRKDALISIVARYQDLGFSP